MAHVFYGDQKKTQKDTSVSTIHAGTDWSSSMDYVFWFIKYYVKLRIYKLFQWVPITIREGIAGVFGQIFLGFSQLNRNKVKQAFQAIFKDNLSKKQLNRLYSAHCSYMGKLTFDFMNGIPIRVDQSLEKFVQFENLDCLESLLKQGKGVIVPCLHLGQLVHTVYAFVKHPKKYTVATIVFTPNLVTYELTNRSWASNVYLYASTKFSLISQYLEHHLAKNHIVLIFHDYGTKNQLRVPFIYGKYSYLLHTPQSHIRLHRKTGAPILPCINKPNGVIGKTKISFLDPQPLQEISKQYWNSSSKLFHGALSTELNRLMNPFIVKYCHVWEEITDFAYTRIADSLVIPPNQTIQSYSVFIFDKLKEIINLSYEPNRNDEKIIDLIEISSAQIRNSLHSPDQFLSSTSSRYINLSKMNGFAEILLILTDLKEIYRVFNEIEAMNFTDQLMGFFYSG